MRITSTTSLLPLLFPLLTSAAHLTITIPANPFLPNQASLLASTHAVLHTANAHYRAPLTRDSTFIFPDVGKGSYLLSVYSRDHAFEDVRVDVSEWASGSAGAAATAVTGEKDTAAQVAATGGGVGAGKEKVEAWQTFRGNEWDNKGERRGGGIGKVMIEVRPVTLKQYYQEKEGFSVLSLFKNPMILIAMFTLVIVVGMPYLMENLDPEELEEIRSNTRLGQGANPTAAVQNFDLAGWMAGKTAGPPSGSAAAAGKK